MDFLLPERVGALANGLHPPSRDQTGLWSKKIRVQKPRKGESNGWLNVSSHNTS